MIHVVIEKRKVEKIPQEYPRRVLIIPQGMVGAELEEYKRNYKEKLFLKMRSLKLQKIMSKYEFRRKAIY